MLVDTYGVKRDCTIMRNGTDMNLEMVSSEEVAKIKNEYGINPNDFVLVSAGRLVSLKNFQLLIDAAAILRKDGIPVKLLIVGDGDYKHALEEKISDLSLEDHVKLIPKTNDRKLLANYYATADLCVLASVFDTSSLVIREGFALKIPALVVKDSAPAEEFIDEHNGFTAEATAEAFAEKIKRIYTHPELLKTASENCYTELYQSWEDIIKDVLAKYTHIYEIHSESSRRKR